DLFRWQPIRSLAPRHRPRILEHLLRLPPGDRYLRFGHVASDSQIARYVDGIDFDADEVLAVFNRRLEVVAMAHLAFLGCEGRPARSAEFGVSVDAGERGRGLGARLFELAVLHARNHRIDTLQIHALAENAAMLHIARSAGAVLDFSGPDATAILKLPPDDAVSHFDAIMEQQAAEFDYGLKLQARRLDDWLELLRPLEPAVPPDSGAAADAASTQPGGPASPP
ncbi:MAG: GNAT family N-acetyltransferase, partial [Burkholderiales bacterium]|nr:GNAT family N-acetyltransferase [Burkholderiales bacterium]